MNTLNLVIYDKWNYSNTYTHLGTVKQIVGYHPYFLRSCASLLVGKPLQPRWCNPGRPQGFPGRQWQGLSRAHGENWSTKLLPRRRAWFWKICHYQSITEMIFKKCFAKLSLKKKTMRWVVNKSTLRFTLNYKIFEIYLVRNYSLKGKIQIV